MIGLSDWCRLEGGGGDGNKGGGLAGAQWWRRRAQGGDANGEVVGIVLSHPRGLHIGQLTLC
jgi:hypothetical protein